MHFQWNPLFETGNHRIDEQHRMLFQLTNDLARAVQQGEQLPTLTALVQQLRDYAATHFCDEEQLMTCSTLARLEKERHVCTHRSFINKVDELALRTDLTDAEAAGAFLEFLITWLVTHILRLDRRVARALAGRPMAADDAHVSTEQVLISALMETERRFRMLSDEAPSFIWISGPSGHRDYANKAWFDFTAATATSGVDWLGYIHPDDRQRYEAQIAACLATRTSASIEFRARNAAGQWGWILEKINPRIENGRCIGLIAAGADISDIKASEEVLTEANSRLEREVAERTRELQNLAMADPLTGLANRRLLMERIEGEVARAARYRDDLALLFIDIDRFKTINDSFGHATGDAALIEVSHLIKGAVRQTDFVGRLGGEEFVVVLLKTTEEQASCVAEVVRAAVAAHHFPQLPVAATVSIGIAAYRPNDTAAALLARADIAMLQAKRDGRNRCRCAAADGLERLSA